MIWLLDGSALIALLLDGHPHNERASKWAEQLPTNDQLAVCSVTEGTLLRMHMQMAKDGSANSAWSTLATFHRHDRFIFLDDGFSYQQVPHRGLLGHKQVTDAWLAQLARFHGTKLATFDAGLVANHPDVAVLIP